MFEIKNIKKLVEIMKIELLPEQKSRRDEFKIFVDSEIIPFADQNDRDEYLSSEIIKKLAMTGYLGSMLPKQYGGTGMDMITVGLLNEEVGRGCSSVRSLLTVQGMVALAILKWGDQMQRERWLPRMAAGEVVAAFALTEPNVGSDAKSIETTAIEEGESYIINGTKKWTTMGQIADLFLVFADCNGKPSAFLVEKNSLGLSISPMKGLLGARASMIAELKLDNCRIPKENIVGSIGTGLSHVALNSLDYGRYTIAWGCVGLGQACLEASIKYVRKRKQFGEPLRQFQLIQKMVTEMVVNVGAARLMCFNAGYLKDVNDHNSIIETWNAKYFASSMVSKVAGDAVQIHGGNGCYREYPVERYYRDAKINEIIEGSSQIHEILIATNAFRQY